MTPRASYQHGQPASSTCATPSAVSDDDIARFNALRQVKTLVPERAIEAEIAQRRGHCDFRGQSLAFSWRRCGALSDSLLSEGEEFAHHGRLCRTHRRGRLEALDASRYVGTTHVGKTGIERLRKRPAWRTRIRTGRGQRGSPPAACDRQGRADTWQESLPDGRCADSGGRTKRHSPVVPARPLPSIHAMAKCWR